MQLQCGVDISTVSIGICVVNSTKDKIVFCKNIKLKSDIDILERANIFEKEIKDVFSKYGEKIEKIFIESAVKSFSPNASSAHTIAIAQRFNGIISYILFKEFGLYKDNPMENITYIMPSSARSKLGIKSAKDRKETKKRVIEYIIKNFPEFEYTLTKYGNYAPGTDDRADAAILALQ